MAHTGLIDLLRRDNAVEDQALASAASRAEETGQPVGILLLEAGEIDEATYARYLAETLEVPYFTDDQVGAANPDLAALLSARTAASMALVVIGEDGDALILACADADNLDRLGPVADELGRPLQVGLGSRSAIAGALETHYGVEGTTLWVDPNALKEALALAAGDGALAAGGAAVGADEGPQGGFPGDADPTLKVDKKEVDRWLADYKAGKQADGAEGDTERTNHPGAVPAHPDEAPIDEPVWHSEASMEAPTVGLIVEPGDLAAMGPASTDHGLPGVGDSSIAETMDSLEAVEPERRSSTDEIKRTVQGFIPAGGFKLAPQISSEHRSMEDDTAVDRMAPSPPSQDRDTQPRSAGIESTGSDTKAPESTDTSVSADPAQEMAMGPTAEQAPSPVKVVIEPAAARHPAPSRPPPASPGMRFRDRYQFVDRLGVGGMAEVWRARVLGAKGFRRMVVVKKILPEYASNRDFTEMFVDEAKIACRLSHPNIAQIYELAEEEGELYMVMEYVDGPDLATVYERAAGVGPQLSAAVAAHVVEQICAGLEYAHRATDDRGSPLNIVHRDITPHNVLVSYEGHVKIIDFGIAKAAAKASVTKVGYMKGKPGYIAPEQALGMPLDHRLDIFAAGIILTELMTHERLFRDSADAVELRKLAVFDPRPLLRWKLRIPGPLRGAAIRALQVRPADRFQSARELGQSLRSWLRKRKNDPKDELVKYLSTNLPPVGGWQGPSA